jgi:hypothetical protein
VRRRGAARGRARRGDLHFGKAGTEGWEDDDIALFDVGEVLLAVLEADEVYVHLTQAGVDARVVDDFVGDVDLVILVKLASLVRQGHGAIYTPAKPVRFRKLDDYIVSLQDIVVFTQLLHQV